MECFLSVCRSKRVTEWFNILFIKFIYQNQHFIYQKQHDRGITEKLPNRNNCLSFCFFKVFYLTFIRIDISGREVFSCLKGDDFHS